MGGHVACMGERRGVYNVSVGKPEGKRPLGRPRLRWEDNTKMDVRIGTCSCWLRIGIDCRHKHDNEPFGSTKCGEYLDWLKTD
jgi:hypothetical protein